VILVIIMTLGLVFALVFWFTRLNPPRQDPLLWKDSPGLEAPRRGTPPLRPVKPQGSVV
jgi:hypothetical protein